MSDAIAPRSPWQSFLEASGLLASGRDPAAVEARLEQLFAAGQAAWPTVKLGKEALAAQLTRRLTPGPGALERLDGLDAPGLFLATACLEGLPRALEEFDRGLLSQVPAFLSRLQPQAGFADEVAQVLREKLFVGGPESGPKIASYTGQGQLSAWLRVVTVRAALNLRERKDAQPGQRAPLGPELIAGGSNPELEVIKSRHQQELARVLEEAVASLPGKQRAALRLHFADNLAGEQIAVQLGVTRSTVVRWLSAARVLLLRETQRLLKQRLQLSPGEVDSFIALARSRLDLSINALLGEPSSSDGE